MAVEVLIKAEGASYESSRAASRGTVITAKQSPAVWGSQEGPPRSVRVTVTDIDMEDAEIYKARWGTQRAIRAVNWDTATDTGLLEFYGALINVKGDGALTLGDVSTVITEWGLMLDSEASNSVRVAADVGVMAGSEGFLGINVEQHSRVEQFESLGYDSGLGTHAYRLQFDPATTAKKYLQIKSLMVERGIVITSENAGTKTIEYTVNLAAIVAAITEELANLTDGDTKYCRWIFKEPMLVAVIAGTAPGQTEPGLASATDAQFRANCIQTMVAA